MTKMTDTNADSSSNKKRKFYGVRTIMELLDVGPAFALGVLAVVVGMVVAASIFFVFSAPPNSITISTGPEGSMFHRQATRYAKILEGNGIKTKILTSQGSVENLQRLNDPASGVDVGFVQAGIPNAAVDKLVSLGSVAYQPLQLYYRGKPIDLVSKLMGKRIAIGPIGSGTRAFALAVLALNGIKENESTVLLDWGAEEASKGIVEGKIDAAFIMSESASFDIMRTLRRSTSVRLFAFNQGAAYSRKISHLSVLELPRGSIDIGLDIPPQDVPLIGPMVELVAARDLHPALVDLLLDAATSVHSRAGIYQKRGEFPAPIEHQIRISEDAARYYKSGKGFLYSTLPYWLASLIRRVIVAFVPVLVLLIPLLRILPAFFRWITQAKINRRYRELLTIEHSFLRETDSERKAQLRNELDQIVATVNEMKVRASFAEQVYVLRGHMDYVRKIMGQA